MATLQEQIATAKAAGYSDDDIANHLSTARPDLAPKIKQATAAGYKSDQIIAHLSGGEAAPKAATQTAPASSAYEPTLGEKISQGALNIGTGLLRGAGSIGATLAYPVDKGMDLYYGDRGPRLQGLIDGKQPQSRNEQRRAQIDDTLSREFGAETDSYGYKGGKLAGEIAGTAGAGGVVGNALVRAAPAAGAAAPLVNALATSARTGGFRTGLPVASTLGQQAANMGVRIAGGGLAGGAAGAMVDPRNGASGALVGGLLPPVLSGVGKVAGAAGATVKALVQPFTAKGQEAIAGNIVRKFAEGGPTTVNANSLVPGSVPTLAEATGNAGLATLQRGARDLKPNAFAEREVANAAARNKAFDEVAGDAGKLDFFRAERSAAGASLYDEALKADTAANLTPYVKGQVTQLLKRPSINEARKTAQRWAIERGEKPSFGANMRGLHDMKMAIDDQISEAVRAGKGGEAKALSATQDKLLEVMEKLSPAYKEARVTYAAMSKPVNQMEVLQGLRITDAKGNITLAKVQNAIDSIERKAATPGNAPEKSLAPDQIATLQAIRDDLLRQSNLGAGKSAGSNTFQNIATDNILGAMLPGKLGQMASGKIGGLAGQAGKLAYSGPNESIRNRLAEMMLDPALARNALTQPQISNSAARFNALLDKHGPNVYRAAPLLRSDQ